MKVLSRKVKFRLFTFLKYDLKASITVFFVALPLCLGVALASGAPVISGLIAGIVGGIVVTIASKSELSVSGPAAGLTAICAAAISKLGALEIFYLSVSMAGLLQILLGLFKLGGFTHFIPSTVIKGMLTAIGVILISKQIPNLIGYDKPDFWSNELINILSFHHVFSNVQSLYENISLGAILIAVLAMGLLYIWKTKLAHKYPFIPASFLVVAFGVLASLAFKNYVPALALQKSQFVSIPSGDLLLFQWPDFSQLLKNPEIFRNAVVICFVASLESLLSITAIDKLDPMNRVTPQNRELMAQGTGNLISGIFGGLPITSVIVRSSANVEAGGKTRLSSFTHGLLILLSILFFVPILNMIPYCVLSVILIRTGLNLAKPKMIVSIYKQGREQFMPYVVTAVSILLTDLLIGVLIGLVYAVYFLIKNTYKAGYTMNERIEGHTKHIIIELALNVSFLSKKPFITLLDNLPEYSIVEINGTKSVYIDPDILELFQDFKAKARIKHIDLSLKNIPSVETIGAH